MNVNKDNNNPRLLNPQITNSTLSIIKTDTNLILIDDWLKEIFKDLKYLIRISVICIIFLIISIILDYTIIGIISLIIIIMLISPVIFLFLSKYTKKTEWNLSKPSSIITYKQVLPRNKLLNELKFSYIKYIFYQVCWDKYILSFFMDSSEEVLICKINSKEYCQDLGILIANFIKKPLYYKLPHNDGLVFIFDPKIDINSSS